MFNPETLGLFALGGAIIGGIGSSFLLPASLYWSFRSRLKDDVEWKDAISVIPLFIKHELKNNYDWKSHLRDTLKLSTVGAVITAVLFIFSAGIYTIFS